MELRGNARSQERVLPVAGKARARTLGNVLSLRNAQVPNLDFKAMYSRAGVASSSDILVEIAAMSEPRKSSAQGVVDEMEEEGRRTLQ